MNAETQESTWYEPGAAAALVEDISKEGDRAWWWPKDIKGMLTEPSLLQPEPPSAPQPPATWLSSWVDPPPVLAAAPLTTAPGTTVQQVAAGTRARPVPPPVIIDEASRSAAMAVAESPFKMLSASLRRVEPLPLIEPEPELEPEPKLEPEPEPEPELPSVQYALFGRSVQPAAATSQLEKDAAYTIQTSKGPVIVAVPAAGGKTKSGQKLTRAEVYSTVPAGVGGGGLREVEDIGDVEGRALTKSVRDLIRHAAVGTDGTEVGGDPIGSVNQGPILALAPSGATFAGAVEVSFALSDLFGEEGEHKDMNGDAVVCASAQIPSSLGSSGWTPLDESEQLTVTPDGTVTVELHEFGKYLFACW